MGALKTMNGADVMGHNGKKVLSNVNINHNIQNTNMYMALHFLIIVKRFFWLLHSGAHYLRMNYYVQNIGGLRSQWN